MAGKKINFLVDTGATYSVLNSYAGPLSPSSINIMGVEGRSQTCFYIPLSPVNLKAKAAQPVQICLRALGALIVIENSILSNRRP